MSQKRAEMQGLLMKEAERIITELLDWEERVEEPNLSQIEQKILKLRERLSQKMAEVVIEHQPARQPVPGPLCAGCGREMEYKGQHPKRVVSWVGELKLERSYHYCKECRQGIFPPG